MDKNIPQPSKEEVEKYLKEWDELENYTAQETALDKLFFKLCPKNEVFSDILLKATTLNKFYSTNVYDVYNMAEHIHKLKDVDARLNDGDLTLVDDIRLVKIKNKDKEKEINYFSFASKYCSHHNPKDFPIYDSYVDKVLRYFQKKDGFYEIEDKASFKNGLKDYKFFKDVLIRFQEKYELKDVLAQFQKDHGMKNYDLKLLDRYLWLLGKEYFPKKFKNTKKENSEK